MVRNRRQHEDGFAFESRPFFVLTSESSIPKTTVQQLRECCRSRLLRNLSDLQPATAKAYASIGLLSPSPVYCFIVRLLIPCFVVPIPAYPTITPVLLEQVLQWRQHQSKSPTWWSRRRKPPDGWWLLVMVEFP